MMNGDILKNILIKVDLLEENVAEIQRKLGETHLLEYIKTDDYSNKNNKKSYDGESYVLDIGGGTDEIQSTFKDNRFKDMKIFATTSRLKNIWINKVKLKKQETIKAREPVCKITPSCIMKIRENWLHNVLWMAVNVLGIIISYIYIKNAYISWQSSPVVQALSNSQIHLENISFPAVTICWPSNFKRGYDLFDNIEKCMDCEQGICRLRRMTCNYTDMTTLVLVVEMCVKYFSANLLPKTIKKYVPRAINKDEFDAYMEKLLPECESDIVTIKWLDGHEPAKLYTRCDNDVFQQFYSYMPKKLCMTYNSLGHKDIFKENVVTTLPLIKETVNMASRANPIWSFDNMIEFKGDWNTTPIYGTDGFLIWIPKQVRTYHKYCNTLVKDIGSIIIHSPNEIPLHFESFIDYSIRNNTGLEIIVVPKVSLAREDLVQYAPYQRGCFFTYENNLTMFKFYTKNNCDLGCLVNAYLKSCGCVPYNYPRQNDSVKVCIRDCMQPKYRCECLPDCNSLTYDVTIQESSIAGVVLPNRIVQSMIELKFKGNKYYTTVRYSITSYAEFLAYSLGVLGGFLGLSVTCVWQLLYSGLRSLWTFVKTLWNNTVSPYDY